MKMNGMTSGTTLSAHLDEFMCNRMSLLLRDSYPVEKIKENKRFKRGVNVNGRVCLLPGDSLILFAELFTDLKLFYGASDDEVVHVIKKFYKLKDN